MDESDEDIDPLVGPVADLMAEHDLSTKTNLESTIDEPVPMQLIKQPDTKSFIVDYLSVLNIRLLFQDVFNYLLDILWYRYIQKMFPENEQEIYRNPRLMYSALRKLFLLSAIYLIVTASYPWWSYCLFLAVNCVFIIVDFLRPLYIYRCWFECFKSIRMFLRTIEIHRQWLINIQGFQLIRPTSSLFEQQLLQLRLTLFQELQHQFLYARRISRQYSTESIQLISSIDLNEFGPFMAQDFRELQTLTNEFDQTSINSMLKLYNLQVNESIQLIHLKRPRTLYLFTDYHQSLVTSIDRLNQTKQKCSLMIHSIANHPERSVSKQLIPAYFLLRSTCEELFVMNENNAIHPEDLKRMIQDLKTVVYSLEGLQYKPVPMSREQTNEQILVNESPAISISSFHRFDDKIDESIDEILIGETDRETNDEIQHNRSNIDHDDQRLLREQTYCLMKELETALEGKKQEWNEREQRLLGDRVITQIIVQDEQPFQQIFPIPNTFSMLDELKHTFVLNKNKLNIHEDVFGEDD